MSKWFEPKLEDMSLSDDGKDITAIDDYRWRMSKAERAVDLAWEKNNDH